MASKPREYNIPTHPNRDFWHSLWPTSPSPPAKGTTAEPTPTYSVPKGSRRAKMPTISEEPSKSKKSKPVRTKSKSKKTSTSKNARSWSEWYLSEDNTYFWRARKLPNDEWDYQKQPKTDPEPEIQPLVPHPHLESISQQIQPKTKSQPEPKPLPHPHMEPISQPNSPKITIEDTTPLTSSSSSSSSSSPERSTTTSKDNNHFLKPPISPALKSHRSGSNPKSSYPTIITKSTGRPTEAITTTNPSPRTSGLALTRIESTSPSPIRKTSSPTTRQQQPHSQKPKVVNPPAKKSSSPKRPLGPVMWLLTEGRSKKGKSLASPPPAAAAPAKKTTPPSAAEKQQPGVPGGNVHLQPGGVVITKNKGSGVSNKELAKKKKLLDKKIKEGKVMDTKVDSKKRIKAWLGGVEGEEELIPLDEEGFPVYR
ncbi:hypothetical protein QBC40DRAFT_337356 [Triangularia verruculosa]|uniref:Uncharacterized protein n=1 Tax=Triangularia verruculosa TaxID=2587418 RepID=A0AAN7AWF7_9PEZI|nr:hypothetical protein QBC40DRAFT_337356 [Triangularia verruculosa]